MDFHQRRQSLVLDLQVRHLFFPLTYGLVEVCPICVLTLMMMNLLVELVGYCLLLHGDQDLKCLPQEFAHYEQIIWFI